MRVLRGAGVVPFFRSSDGEPQFVFGRERFVHNWSGSNLLSAFSGSPLAGETAEQVATREMMEESVACFPTANLREALEDEDFALRVWSRYNRTDLSAKHVTYVKEFAPSLDWKSRFEQIQTCIVAVQQTHSRLRESRRIVQTYNATLDTGGVVNTLPLDDKHSRVTSVAMCTAYGTRSPQLHVVCETAAETATETAAETTIETRHDITAISPRILRAYMQWFQARHTLECNVESVRRLCPQSLCDSPYDCDGPCFVDAFLEKDMLLSSSLRQLREMVHRNAHHGLFRREFVAVLIAITHEFREQFIKNAHLQ